MSQAVLELVDLPRVLDQPHLGGDAREVGVGRLVGRDQGVDARVDAALHAGLAGAGQRLRQVVEVAHLDAERGGDLVRGRPAAGPQLAVLAVAEELVGVALRARSGVEDGLAVVDDEDRVGGLVAGEVGVRGVRAEAVVGVVGADLVAAGRQHQTLAGEQLGEPAPALGGVRRHGMRRQVELALAPALAHELGVGLGNGGIVGLGVELLGLVVSRRPPGGCARSRPSLYACARHTKRGLGALPDRLPGMAGRPRNSVAFTVVVTVLSVVGALVHDPRHRPLGSPGVTRPGHRAGRPAGGSAGRLLPVAGPLRARAEGAAGDRPGVGRLRRDRRARW